MFTDTLEGYGYSQSLKPWGARRAYIYFLMKDYVAIRINFTNAWDLDGRRCAWEVVGCGSFVLSSCSWPTCAIAIPPDTPVQAPSILSFCFILVIALVPFSARFGGCLVSRLWFFVFYSVGMSLAPVPGFANDGAELANHAGRYRLSDRPRDLTNIR